MTLSNAQEHPQVLQSGMSTQDRVNIMVDQLGRWLNLKLTTIAELTGTNRGTLYYWRKEGSVPQQATFERVLRLHTVIQALVTRYGENRATTWFCAGSPSPRLLWLDGRYEEVERAAHDEIVPRTRKRERDFRGPEVRIAEVDDPEAPARALPSGSVTSAFRRVGRRST